AAELVAYVTEDGDTNYGFSVGNTKSGRVRVVAFNTKAATDIDYERVVSIYPVSLSSKLLNQVRASLSKEQEQDEIKYWTQLYSYAPEYLEQIIRDVEAGTFA